MDDTEAKRLLGRIAQADEAAFRTLYKAFSRKIYAYSLRQLSDPSQAEEVVSDTLYEVWKNPGGFRGDSQFSTWLIGIARNKCLMALRSRTRPDNDHDDVDELAEVLAADEGCGFDVLAQKQRHEGVQHCMGKLGGDHRECIHLVFYEGMSIGEIAQVQGCPEGTIKTRLFHARQKLRNCLRLLVEREGGTLPGEVS